MINIPYGTRHMAITCPRKTDSQFRGIHDALELLERQRRLHHYQWRGTPTDLSRRRVLQWVVVSGHGTANMARLSGGHQNTIDPGDLILPRNTNLFPLGCHQGRAELREQWANGSGLDLDRVFGCQGETDSALSTMFLLNLLESGMQSAMFWFERWDAANSHFRQRFPEIRDVYQESGSDYLTAFSRISKDLDLTPFDDFLSVGSKYPACLSHL